MALPPLATTAELAVWMEVEEATLPAKAEMALNIASALARKEARTSFAAYASAPWDVKGVVMDAAKRSLLNPNSLRQETVGSVSVTYAAETIGISLAEAERDILGRYARRAAMVKLVEEPAT